MIRCGSHYVLLDDKFDTTSILLHYQTKANCMKVNVAHFNIKLWIESG